MDDSFLNNSLLDLDLQEQNCVNPDIACGFEINKQPTPPHSESIMFNRIPLKRFCGYPREDAERFLSNFKAYATFSNLETNDRKQAAALQLHLEGPAQSWFASLKDDITCHWDSLCAAFRQKYISSDNRPILLVETEHFMNLRLQPHQQIEDHYSIIKDKGRRIHNTTQDILLKFTQGLPPQLAFFVRA